MALGLLPNPRRVAPGPRRALASAPNRIQGRCSNRLRRAVARLPARGLIIEFEIDGPQRSVPRLADSYEYRLLLGKSVRIQSANEWGALTALATLTQLAAEGQLAVAEVAYLHRVRTELFQGDLVVDPNLSYLDIGCGMGRLSLGLAAAGATDVTGVEIVDRNIVEATALAEKLLPEGQRPTFINRDIHNWDTDKTYDVIIVLGALEHIHDQDTFLRRCPSTSPRTAAAS